MDYDFFFFLSVFLLSDIINLKISEKLFFKFLDVFAVIVNAKRLPT